jgi:predicted glycogen debranching enzyme
MPVAFQNHMLYRFDKAIDYEWIEANGLGGYASSTVIGTHTRKYHGLLISAQNPPVERKVMVSKMDETIWLHGKATDLGCNKYLGAIHPEGYIFLQSFERDLFPVFTYKVNQILIRKTIAAVQGENTTLLLYEVLEAPEPFWMEWTPLVAGRDIHSVVRSNGDFQTNAQHYDDTLWMRPYTGGPDAWIHMPGAQFRHEGNWYQNFEYLAESKRGVDAVEDLYSPGKFGIEMKEGDRFGCILTSESGVRRDPWALFEAETRRREALLAQAPETRSFARRLVLAADQFVVRHKAGRSTVVAGYPWFADWGRDTFISLQGLSICTGRPELARDILRSYAGYLKGGLIPNQFSDYGDATGYQSADSTLWFLVAGYKYFKSTGDTEFAKKELLPWVKQVVSAHEQGCDYHIFVDQDGLLSAGGPGYQLTWMDARVGEWLFTPRAGKTVEVNALWYNVLEIFAELLRTAGDLPLAESVEKKVSKTRQAFLSTFWNEAGGYLYDFVRGEYHDDAIRPNQLAAISLPFQLLSHHQADTVLQTVTKHLFTPWGLRTLSPTHTDYRPRYVGNQFERDQAYHHGTSWAWLLGWYIDALVRVNGVLGKNHARNLLEALQSHLDMAGLGSVSEIFDGASPHEPRGCIAQAWSVAEWLRVMVEYRLLDPPAELLGAEKRMTKKIRIEI